MKNKYAKSPEGRLKNKLKNHCKENYPEFKGVSTLESAEELTDKIVKDFQGINRSSFITSNKITQDELNELYIGLRNDHVTTKDKVEWIVVYDVATKWVQYYGNEHWFSADDLAFREKHNMK